MYDVLIAGGGAAGLAAACALAEPGRLRVALLEKQPRVGRKLLSTGNGRCNLTNVAAAPAHYHGARGAAARALALCPPADVLAFFERLGVPAVIDGEGRAYPMSNQAASVLDALRLCAAEHGCEIQTGCAVTEIVPLHARQAMRAGGGGSTAAAAAPSPLPAHGETDGASRRRRASATCGHDRSVHFAARFDAPAERDSCRQAQLGAEAPAGFDVHVSDGRTLRARRVIVCTGGLAAPKLGACGDGYRLLAQLGHPSCAKLPAIAALKAPPDAVRGLKGLRVSCAVALTADGHTLREERGEVLFAEAGVSGIAAMQLARACGEALHMGRRCAVRLNLLEPLLHGGFASGTPAAPDNAAPAGAAADMDSRGAAPDMGTRGRSAAADMDGHGAASDMGTHGRDAAADMDSLGAASDMGKVRRGADARQAQADALDFAGERTSAARSACRQAASGTPHPANVHREALAAQAVAMLRERMQNLPDRPLEDFLNGILPRRVGQAVLRAAGIAPMTRPARSLSDAEVRALADALTGWTIPVDGVLGFDHAQVTAGGTLLDGFDWDSLASLRVPGLYAAGEVLDVDGDCGGFNLQWAWSSALLAARAILREMGVRK